MVKRRVYQSQKHVHFVTFSCYKRRNHLQHDQAKRIVIGNLGSRLAAHEGCCLGFVIMNDHVHALVWFPKSHQISSFMNKWKELTSKRLKTFLSQHFPNYWSRIESSDPVWQPRYYDFNIWSRTKVEEKLDYMHLNPVRAGYVERAADWRWGSAPWYLLKKSVGIPIAWPPGLETDDDCTVGE